MLSVEGVKHIAHLARIGVTEEEIEKYQKNLSKVLDFFQELQALDTESVAPVGHITGALTHPREDRAQDFGSRGNEALRKNFPDSKNGFLKVKSVF